MEESDKSSSDISPDKWNKLGSKRGVDTLIRSTYRTQVDLTSVADGKANIMISINGIILSVILATILPQIADQSWTVIPTAILIFSSVITLVLAVLAAIPRVTRRKVSLEQIRRNKESILFFGHFAHLSRGEFEQGLRDVLFDREMVYGNLIRDIYNAGVVLEKKFRLLRLSYIAFITGIVVSLAAYVVFFSSSASVGSLGI
ncbi:MAG: hypothetical protein HKN43_17365 [Rhodothermales bacterium]|nr:hypothetical protein [Rhodothermales bacterium]